MDALASAAVLLMTFPLSASQKRPAPTGPDVASESHRRDVSFNNWIMQYLHNWKDVLSGWRVIML